MDSDFMALERDEGVESRRLSFRGGYKIPHVTSNGHYFEFKTSLRADGYNVNNVPDPLNPTHDEEGSVGRLIPEAQLDWSFPVVRYEENMHIYLEPVANFIVSPYGNNPNKIPNEDSQDVELSDVNLFSANHFTGLDLVEDGPRTNYGLRGGVYGTDGKRMNFLFGQTYRARESEQFKEESGLRENFSDYVGRLSLNDGKNVEFSYRFRLDKDEMDFHRNEFEATLNFNPLRLSADYVMLDENVATNPDLDREEVASAISYDLSSQWTIHGYARRDLSSDGGLISAGSGLQFHNECLMVNTQFGREFTRDRDIEPSTAFTIQIGFKNLN
jgi:LPS-assembly protein